VGSQRLPKHFKHPPSLYSPQRASNHKLRVEDLIVELDFSIYKLGLSGRLREVIQGPNSAMHGKRRLVQLQPLATADFIADSAICKSMLTA
jgi:hypothetical protein